MKFQFYSLVFLLLLPAFGVAQNLRTIKYATADTGNLATIAEPLHFEQLVMVDSFIYAMGSLDPKLTDFDINPQSQSLYSSGFITKYDGYFAKYDQDMNLIWKKIHKTSRIANNGIEVTGYNSVIYHPYDQSFYGICGAVGVVDINPSNETTIVNNPPPLFFPNQNNSGLSFAKLDTSAQVLWHKEFNIANVDSTFRTDIKLLPQKNGNVYLLGELAGHGNLVIDSGVSYPKTQAQFRNLPYIANYSPNGNLIWYRVFTGTYWSGIYTTATVDFNDNLIMAGIFIDTINIDTGSGMITKIADDSTGSGARYSNCILKYDTSGQLQYFKTIKAYSYIDITNCITDDANNLYLGCTLRGTVNISTDSSQQYLVSAVNQAGNPINSVMMCAKYDSLGNLSWGKVIGTSDVSFGKVFGFSKNNDVMMAGGTFINLQQRCLSYAIVDLDKTTGNEVSRISLDTSASNFVQLPNKNLLGYGYIGPPACRIEFDFSPNSFVSVPQKSLVFVALYGSFGVSTHAPLVGGTSIYPTPATHELVVERSAARPPALATLYDLWGRVVLATTLTQPCSQLGVGELPSGFYVLRIAGEGRSYKVVVQH